MKITCHRHYWVLLGLILLFAAPGLAAYALYQHPQWLTSTTNKGVFLKPPVLVNALKKLPNSKMTLGHQGLRPSSSAPKWQLVLWNPGACQKKCMAQLEQLARVRLALGRRLYDVEFQLLLEDSSPLLAKQWVVALRDQDIKVTRLTTKTPQRSAVLGNHPAIFIANSDGYLVLAFHPDANPDDIYHDMRQLLTTTK